jgi:predicted phosphate transport protein (TIGR00153 family)
LNERKSLLEWFGVRRESMVRTGIRSHTIAVGDATAELNKAVSALCGDDKEEAMDAIKRLLMAEDEADLLEASISADLTKGDLDSREREDLLRLVRRIDYISDWAKESALNLQLLLEADVHVPCDLWSRYAEMTNALTKAAKALLISIENLGVNNEKATQSSREVERQEHVIDDLYFSTKKAILFSDTDPRAVFLLRDMLHGIENSADSCKDVADMIYILIISDSRKVR